MSGCSQAARAAGLYVSCAVSMKDEMGKLSVYRPRCRTTHSSEVSCDLAVELLCLRD